MRWYYVRPTPERRSYINSTHSTLILHNFALIFGVDLTYLALNFSVDLTYLALNLALILHKFNAFNAIYVTIQRLICKIYAKFNAKYVRSAATSVDKSENSPQFSYIIFALNALNFCLQIQRNQRKIM